MQELGTICDEFGDSEMTPEYIEELADIADPEQLWRTGWPSRIHLTGEKRKQLDAGIALRRYAFHIKRLKEVLDANKSLLITPMSSNSSAIKSVDTPEDHEKLRKVRDA
jgi:hypothetical protein